MKKKEIVVGITGASGSIYGIELVKQLQKLDCIVHLLITSAGWQVILSELLTINQDHLQIGRSIPKDDQIKILNDLEVYMDKNTLLHNLQDFSVGIASGSYQYDAMVVVPCSMGTLSAIALGASDNLLERVADTALKEARQLIIVPRETPLNRIHLKNLLTLSEAGATIMPAMPAFYHNPQNLQDIVLFLVGKILDQLKIEHHLFKRWG